MSVTVARPSVFAPVRSLDARSLGGPALEVNVAVGERLVRAGQLLGTFFVIRAGRAELRDGEGDHGSLGNGDCFGEIDPSTPRPQPYDVVAVTPMRLLAFSAVGIGRLCATFPGLRERLLGCLP
jgi:CRP-like cAMP-binding protein